jgi:hypothetical protein
MVTAPQDREMASRIVAVLPARRLPWLALTPRWAVHAMAAASLAAVAAIWIGRGTSAPELPDRAAARVPAVPMTGLAPLPVTLAANGSGLAVVARSTPPPALPTDHERALPPVTPPGDIVVAALVADRMEIAPAMLEPLIIDALSDGGAPPDSKEQ